VEEKQMEKQLMIVRTKSQQQVSSELDFDSDDLVYKGNWLGK
jgi:hypothetical protein